MITHFTVMSCPHFSEETPSNLWSALQCPNISNQSTLGLNELTKFTFNVFFQLLVIGGSFGLKEFTQIRYDAQRIRKKVCCKLTLILHILNGDLPMINVTVD